MNKIVENKVATHREILLAIGANLPNGHETPLQTCQKAVELIKKSDDMTLLSVSHWYQSEPVPPSGQPPFINVVIKIKSALSPLELLTKIHIIENKLGRQRSYMNAPRTLDLDIVDIEGFLCHMEQLMVPHPRMVSRLFVLMPLRDVAPGWIHPITGMAVEDLISQIREQKIEPIPDRG